MNTFLLTPTQPKPGWMLFQLAGAADLLAVEKIEAAMQQLSSNNKGLIIDLAQVSFMNTPVWALFSIYADTAAESGRRIAVCAMSEKLRASYDMMGLDNLIPAYASSADAVAALAGGQS
jgi:anti-anti-sigma factor